MEKNKKTLFERYRRNFVRKLETLSTQYEKQPFGYGKSELKKLGVLTVAVVFSTAKAKARSRFTQRLTEEERQRKIGVRVLELHREFAHLWEYADEMTEEGFNVHARQLGNAIYDLPFLWTGYQSQESLETGDKTNEHFYPRLLAGQQILKFIFEHGGIMMHELRSFFEVFRQVHYTTVNENQKLKKVQDTKTFTDWQSTYKEMCSPLVCVEDKGDVLTFEKVLESLKKERINTLDREHTNVYAQSPLTDDVL